MFKITIEHTDCLRIGPDQQLASQRILHNTRAGMRFSSHKHVGDCLGQWYDNLLIEGLRAASVAPHKSNAEAETSHARAQHVPCNKSLPYQLDRSTRDGADRAVVVSGAREWSLGRNARRT